MPASLLWFFLFKRASLSSVSQLRRSFLYLFHYPRVYDRFSLLQAVRKDLQYFLGFHLSLIRIWSLLPFCRLGSSVFHPCYWSLCLSKSFSSEASLLKLKPRLLPLPASFWFIRPSYAKSRPCPFLTESVLPFTPWFLRPTSVFQPEASCTFIWVLYFRSLLQSTWSIFACFCKPHLRRLASIVALQLMYLP